MRVLLKSSSSIQDELSKERREKNEQLATVPHQHAQCYFLAKELYNRTRFLEQDKKFLISRIELLGRALIAAQAFNQKQVDLADKTTTLTASIINALGGGSHQPDEN